MAKRKSKRGNPPKPYRSWLEYDFHKKYNQLDYEPNKVPYHIERNYTPDYVSPSGKYLIELKGFFRSGDIAKYKAIRKCLPKGKELVFIWQNPKAPITGSRKKKDGTRTTYAEWCGKNEFKWATTDTMPKEWRQ